MDKTKVSLVVAPILVSIICIILAVNVAVAKSQLNAEKAKALTLDARVREIGAQLTDANIKARKSQDLQNALDAARREMDTVRQQVVQANQQINTLVSQKNDLETRLNAAINALQPLSEPEEATSATE